MTLEEAVFVLNRIEAHGSLVIEAKKMAIEALRKQIPQRATIIDGEVAYCFKCKRIFGDSYEYCPHCGQALDWSDDE